MVQPIKKGEYRLCVVSYVAVIMDADVQIKMELVLPIRITPDADAAAGVDTDVDAEFQGAVILVLADAETVGAETAVLNLTIPAIPVPADAEERRSMTENAVHIGRVTAMDGAAATGRAGMMRPGTGTEEREITV